jgi:shikimate dehydrogenase
MINLEKCYGLNQLNYLVSTINKNTKIYCSFSSTPGNNGCIFFNTKFQENNINAIYKSFYSDNIKNSIEAVKTLDIKGFAVSMPFKVEVLKYVDEIDIATQEIGAANTITNNNGYLKAYNTDWLGIKNYFTSSSIDFLNIIGNGGFSKAAQFFCKTKNIPYKVVTRENWSEIKNLEGYIFNATPIDIITKDKLIDGRPHTEQGKIISIIQAEEQYKIYMNG